MTKAKPDYLDFDRDNNTKESMKKALRDIKSKSVKEGLIGGQTKIDVAAPYGKLTSADFKELRKGKRKKIKEGYSNWREDLIEIADKIPSKDKETKIVEKDVDNKIIINPNIGEAVESLGGTLIEMIEIDEVDYIVESVYEELLGEGYEEDDIEEALEYALVEAKVTFGHDTPTGQKKKSNLLGAVGRLARQKLSSKYRGAKRAVSSAAISGLRNVAKGALGAARKLEGDKKPSQAHTKTRTASTYRGAGVGQRERVSSGSYSAPKPEAPKPQAKTTKVPAKTSEPDEGLSARQQAEDERSRLGDLEYRKKIVALRLQKRKLDISPQDIKRAISNITEDYYDLASKSVKPGKPGEEAEANKKSWGDYWSSAAKGYKEQYEILEKAESEQQQKLFGLALSVKRGQTSRDTVSDKVLEIVDSMSEKKIRDFAKTPHKGLPHKIETKEEAIRQEFIARMVSKIEEQSEIYVDEARLPRSMKKGKVKSGDIVPVRVGKEGNLSDPKIGIRKNTSPSGSPKETQRRRKQQKMGEAVDVNMQPKSQQSDQQNVAQKKAVQQQSRQRQQEVQILQRKLQALKSAPKGIDTDITA